MLRVVVIIVCYNGVADTLECLDSVSRLTYPDVQVILVDNASTDGTAGAVRERFPSVTVIESVENQGFAGGNNVGVRHALDNGAAYTFLLNNDTTVESGLLEPLVAYAEAHTDAGIVGPLMCYYDHPETVWASGGSMNRRGESLLRDNGARVTDIPEAVRASDFVVGCGMLIRRDVWDNVGLFDERFFLYYEDADLCFRAAQAGYRNVTLPAARLYHKVSRSTGADSDQTLYYMRRNALLFLQKNGNFAGRVAAICDDFRLILVWQLQGKKQRARVLTSATADYFAARFGRKNLSH